MHTQIDPRMRTEVSFLVDLPSFLGFPILPKLGAWFAFSPLWNESDAKMEAVQFGKGKPWLGVENLRVQFRKPTKPELRLFFSGDPQHRGVFLVVSRGYPPTEEVDRPISVCAWLLGVPCCRLVSRDTKGTNGKKQENAHPTC